MTTPETAYPEIEKLVQKFKNTSARERKAMNENATRQGFILPMFRALGWDIDNINEVSPEEKVSRGFVDFSFRIGGVPRYFLETKRANEDLTNPQWVRQAVDYAWTKSVTWALLSDFEGLIVFNAEAKTENPFQSRFLDFDLDSYLPKFEQLWWLSREQTLAGRLNTEADKFGRVNKRLPVSQELFADLKKWREILFNDFKLYTPMLPHGDVDNAILHTLNRLIFIRTAEDRQVEPVRLRAFVRELRDRKQFKNWGAELSKLFREMDGIYNSELFAPHFSDGLEFSPSVLEEVIEGLYQKHYILYNFNALEADVLGTVYEQYLGAVVADKSEEEISDKGKGAKQVEAGAGMTVQERRKKRKSQGIYYTPAFVTKYIVQQTVGKYVAENGYNPSKPPRILDMACGSGSFLIEAFDVMDKFVMNLRKQNSEFSQNSEFLARARQLEVLQNCIYGVDKDKQALEVARLNLLLRALHSPEKLPLLKNFHLGDGLHSDTWEMGFPDVMKDGGFDIIIGNPPYVSTEMIPLLEKEFYRQKTKLTGKELNLFALFLEQAILNCKDNGFIGFILPDSVLLAKSYKSLREIILENTSVEEIVNIPGGAFKDAVLGNSVILILRKHKSIDEHKIRLSEMNVEDVRIEYSEAIPQSVYQDTPDKSFLLNAGDVRFMNKIEQLCQPLIVLSEIKDGVKTGNNEKYISNKKTNKKHVPVLVGSDINKYRIDYNNKYLLYDRSALARPREERIFLSDKKIIVRQTGDTIIAALDTNKFYTLDNTHLIILSSDSEMKSEYILGLLNSRLIDKYYAALSGEKGRLFAQVRISNLSKLPIRRIDFSAPAEKSAHDEIVQLVEKMLALQKERQAFTSKLYQDEIQKVEREIAYVDEEINQRVYRLYGLTEDEVKIVEGK